jgi:hypothetical protein
MKTKVEMYEAVLHRIQLYREVILDHDKLIKLLDNIGRWSYAHRRGNGELSEEEQDALVKKAFDNLLNVEN